MSTSSPISIAEAIFTSSNSDSSSSSKLSINSPKTPTQQNTSGISSSSSPSLMLSPAKKEQLTESPKSCLSSSNASLASSPSTSPIENSTQNSKKISSFSITDLLSGNEKQQQQQQIKNSNPDLNTNENSNSSENENKCSPYPVSKKFKSSSNHSTSTPKLPDEKSKFLPPPPPTLQNHLNNPYSSFLNNNLPLDMFTAEKIFQQLQQQHQSSMASFTPSHHPMFMPNAPPGLEQFLLHHQNPFNSLMGHHQLPGAHPFLPNEFFFDSSRHELSKSFLFLFE